MRFLRLISAGPLRYASVLMGFSSGDLEKDICVCCSFLNVSISSCFGGESDIKFEQNRGGARGRELLFNTGGEITRSHLGALFERICSEQVFA